MKKIVAVPLMIIISTLIPVSSGMISASAYNNHNYGLITNSHQEGVSDAFNSDIDDRINQLMLEGNIPSLAASVVYKDKIIWSKTYGEQSDKDIAFILASITKTFTATALLQLYERGLYDLDDDVNNYLPFSLRNPNYPDEPITFRSLLLHQSSLQRGGGHYQSFVFNDLDRQLGITDEITPAFPAWLDDVFLSPEAQNTSEVWGTWTPGSKIGRLAYSNLGYDLLGYLIELISNQTIEDFFESNIFSPLDMTKTHYTHQSYSSDELAFPYEWIPDEENEYNFTTDENNNFRIPHFNLDELGAGALRSTTTDLSHFLIAHMNNGKYKNNRILSKESIELMHNKSQVYYSKSGYSYGFAWISDRINTVELDGDYFLQPLQGHSGRTFGFNSQMFFNQDTKLGVILLINQDFLYVPQFDNQLSIFNVLYKEGFRYSRQHKSSGFSFFLISLTIILYVIFSKSRKYKKKR